jgi:hypothetical protein
MAPLKVYIKHAGKKHDIELDPEKPPVAFKEAVYQLTGVPVDRMKVMVKGGVLKVCRNFWKITRRRKLDMMVTRMIPIGKKLGPKKFVLSLSHLPLTDRCNRARLL